MTGEDYEARKDEHRPDWPGYATDHLPECPAAPPNKYGRACICDRLRACEQRVAAETISRLDRWQQHSPLGRKTYDDGLSAARDAVEAVGQQHPKWDLMSTHYEDCWKHHSECALTLALAAIDALRGDDA